MFTKTDDSVTQISISEEAEDNVAIWVAVLSALIHPIFCTIYVILVKHATETNRLAPYDFSISYWGLATLVFQIIGLVNFARYEGSFNMNMWINGTIASFFNLTGCVFCVACFATSCPAGPAAALIGTQTIFVTIIVAIYEQSTPNAM